MLLLDSNSLIFLLSLLNMPVIAYEVALGLNTEEDLKLGRGPFFVAVAKLILSPIMVD